MSARRWTTPILIAAVAAMLGLAVWLDRAAARSSEDLAASLRQQKSLVNDIQEMDRRIEQLDADWAQSRRKSLVIRAGKKVGGPPDAGGPAASAAAARATRVMRANVDTQFRSLLQRLGLSPVQIGQWEAAAAEHSLMMRDIVTAAADQGLTPRDPGVIALLQSETKQWENQQADLVGADASAQLDDYTRVLPAAQIANELAGRVFGSDSPLTAAQGSQLTQIMANASATYKQGGGANPNSIDWDSALAQAQGVLSASQLAALQAVSVNRQIRMQLSQRVAALNRPQ